MPKQKDLKSKPFFIGNRAQAPEFMRYNPYIETGYRINFDTFWKLGKSLFMLHNETVNIWSHLIGALAFVVLMRHTYIWNIKEPAQISGFENFNAMGESKLYQFLKSSERAVQGRNFENVESGLF